MVILANTNPLFLLSIISRKKHHHDYITVRIPLGGLGRDLQAFLFHCRNVPDDGSRALASLAQTCHRLHMLANPIAYHRPRLVEGKEWSLLRILAERRDLASVVRSLPMKEGPKWETHLEEEDTIRDGIERRWEEKFSLLDKTPNRLTQDARVSLSATLPLMLCPNMESLDVSMESRQMNLPLLSLSLTFDHLIKLGFAVQGYQCGFRNALTWTLGQAPNLHTLLLRTQGVLGGPSNDSLVCQSTAIHQLRRTDKVHEGHIEKLLSEHCHI